MTQNVLTASRGGRFGDVSGLRARKRDETRRRIAAAAVELVAANGIAATTVEQIAEHAEVGRATFFRYFESKELAVAAGLNEVAVYVFALTLSSLPASLGPLQAVREAHRLLSDGFDEMRAMYLEQALLSRSSPAMAAWTLYLYVDWEVAIADAVRPRFGDIADDDARPALLGAMTMAATRLAVDEWVAGGGTGHLPSVLARHLGGFELS